MHKSIIKSWGEFNIIVIAEFKTKTLFKIAKIFKIKIGTKMNFETSFIF